MDSDRPGPGQQVKRRRESRPVASRPGGDVDWKLLFNQLFAHEIKKEHVLPSSAKGTAEAFDRLLRAFCQYTPASFNDAIEDISAVGSSEAAYEARVAFFENPNNRRMISDLDFTRSVGEELRAEESIRRYLDRILSHAERPIAEDESFFESAEGQNTLGAFGVDEAEGGQEVALVLVPGYGGHSVKFYLFEEMVRDANLFHDRPAERPLLREEGLDLEFEDHGTFYGRGRGGEATFDILQPMGQELGNTTGFNAETTGLLHQWIQSLPEAYAKKKLIFLGYSKGAPVVLDLVNRHPELASRVLGYVTFAGVIQGTHVARLALEQAATVLRDVPLGEFVDQLRQENPERLGRMLSPLFSDVDLSWLSVPRIRDVFELLGFDVTPLERQIDRILGGREIRELLDGARDLSPLERARWNLGHLNTDTFTRPTVIFNVSALTDLKDFVRPTGLRLDGSEAQSLLTPLLTDEGQIDWKHLSLDALFLYFTSLEGFKSAPGGLFDTQVELGSTKTSLLDRRPLSETLTPAELEALWADDDLRAVLKSNGVRSFDELANRPRRDLVSPERAATIESVDLGEFRGHHWSLFVQALRPPPEVSTEHAVWDFPRKAFMRALLQVLALHNLVRSIQPAPEQPPKEEDRPPPPVVEARPQPETPQPSAVLRDVVFFRTEGDASTRTHLLNLFNLASRAVTYGLVVNSARTGLGTAPPVGPALASESFYYQALRVYSYFDWEFKRILRTNAEVWPLPRTLALVVGRFDEEFADARPEETFERMADVRKVLDYLAPRLAPFELRRLEAGDFAFEPTTDGVTLAETARDSLWRGTRAKLRTIERDGCGEGCADLEAKLEAMLYAFTPLCTVFGASFDRSSLERSVTHLTLYLPPLHMLRAEDVDQPDTWVLERGLKRLELRRPVQLATAEITQLQYLTEPNPSKTQAIKIDLRRDFTRADRVTTVASFGSLFSPTSEDLFGLDTSDHRDALHVLFRPRFDLDDSENPADRAFREAFNRIFSNFEVEARIHQLTLHMRRLASGVQASWDDSVLRPRFSLEDSRISFRVHRFVETAVERLPLQAAGFSCEEIDDWPRRFHCWRDFWTWDHLLEEFFTGGTVGSGRLWLPAYFRERLVEQLVGSATRAVLDRSFASIEDAIDEQIAGVIEDALKRYTKARSVLVDRLHEGLFQPSIQGEQPP